MKNLSILRIARSKAVCLFMTILLFYKALISGNPDFSPIPLLIHTGSIASILTKNDEPLGDFQSITIPLKRAGRLFLIEAHIDGEVGNLIFDTGATGLVLNKTYFRKYAGLEKTAGGGITGGVNKVSSIVVKLIDISGLYYENVTADVADLAHLENRRGVKILGLFGLNMIDNFEVVFDASNNELQLYRIDKQGNRLNREQQEMKFDFVQKIETLHNIMVIKGQIGDKTMSFCLDTGAESNVISSSAPKKVMSTVQINRRSGMAGAGGRTMEVLYGTMGDFRFGNHQFGAMETLVTNLDAISEAYGCTIDGLLGYDFFQKGIFCINFVRNEICYSAGKGQLK